MTWKKEFNKLNFPHEHNCDWVAHNYNKCSCQRGVYIEIVRKFIESIFQKEREEIIEWAEKNKSSGIDWNNNFASGIGAFKRDLIKHLKDK